MSLYSNADKFNDLTGYIYSLKPDYVIMEEQLTSNGEQSNQYNTANKTIEAYIVSYCRAQSIPVVGIHSKVRVSFSKELASALHVTWNHKAKKPNKLLSIAIFKYFQLQKGIIYSNEICKTTIWNHRYKYTLKHDDFADCFCQMLKWRQDNILNYIFDLTE